MRLWLLARQHHVSLKLQLAPLPDCLPALDFVYGSLRLCLATAVSGSRLSPPQARQDPTAPLHAHTQLRTLL